MKKAKVIIPYLAAFLLAVGAWAQAGAPLQLVKTVPLPGLHGRDFDHFTADPASDRLFSAAEEYHKVLVFNLQGKLLHTISDVKAPHSLLYRDDQKKLYVIDSDLGGVKIYDGVTYKPVGFIKTRLGADSSNYDPATQTLYVITGGFDVKMKHAYLTAIDTNTEKIIKSVPIDSDNVEAIEFDNASPRMFVMVRGNHAVEVFNRHTLQRLATWPLGPKAACSAVVFDAADHRLLIGSRSPGTLWLVNSDTGQVINSQKAPEMVDDIAYNAAKNQIYYLGTEKLEVYQRQDADHWNPVASIPTGYRAKTGTFVPQVNRLYVGVAEHGKSSAKVLIFKDR